jgi:hypothetical protein
MFIKKSRLVALIVACFLVFGSAGVLASDGIQQITAHFNHNIKFVLDGKPWTPTDHNGKKFSPIVKDGYSYLPTRAVAEATGATISWDGSTQTITITTSKTAGIPYNDNSNGPALGTSGSGSTSSSGSSGSNHSSSSSSATSSNKGTLDDPVKLGTAFTFTDYYNYGSFDHYSAKYTIKVTKVTPISRDEIANMGFKRPEDDPKIDYVSIDVDLKVENATFKKGAESYFDYKYLQTYRPSVWGVRTKSGFKIIGGRDFGFDGSLGRNAESVTNHEQVYEGDSKSYSASGKILMPVYKNEENYMVIQRQDSTLEYEDTFIYFRLQ